MAIRYSYEDYGNAVSSSPLFTLDDRLVAIDELNVEAVLDITIDTDQQDYEPGDTIVYTITVQNSGEVDATEVNIADMFPSNIQRALVEVVVGTLQIPNGITIALTLIV